MRYVVGLTGGIGSGKSEVAALFPKTLGANLKQPPSIQFGQKLDERPADEWRDLGAGRRFWKSRYEEP